LPCAQTQQRAQAPGQQMRQWLQEEQEIVYGWSCSQLNNKSAEPAR
jgi:hypothetical protein